MSRRYGYYSTQAERQRAAYARWQAAELRRQEAERRRQERQARLDHQAAQQEEADELTAELEHRGEELRSLLTSAVARTNWALDVASLKRPLDLPPFDAQGADIAAAAPEEDRFLASRPGFLARLVPGSSARHAAAVERGRAAYQMAVEEHRRYEEARIAWLTEARRQHETACQRLQAEIAEQHQDVERLARGYRDGDSAAVVQYFTLVLHRDPLPTGFPDTVRVAYIPESRQLVVERELPDRDVVPLQRAFRYVRTRDVIEATRVPATVVRSTYATVVTTMALRTVYGLFQSDTANVVDTLVLNGFVNTTDPATGRSAAPCLLTVRVTKDAIRDIDLSRVDPAACLKSLHAQVSPSPHEMAPVRPIVDFDMVDPRFVASTDVLSTLDQRPNLAELTYQQFEALIENLFTHMGLETRLTQPSRDGGVDCVAWDMRPVVGGKVIVQAKRYKNTVGVSAVRDLYGAVHSEGAAKGILVTTSGYGKSAYEFARNKPLELISGGELLYLLAEHTGTTAKIDFPVDWTDPVRNPEEALPPPGAAAGVESGI